MNPYDSFMRKHLQHYGYYTGYKNSCNYPENSDIHVIQDEFCELSGDSTGDSETEDANKETSTLDIHDDKIKDELLRTTQIVYSNEDGRIVPHLREPRQLYGFYTSLYGPQQPARWPAGIQVFLDRVRHIRSSPKEPEFFYKSTGQENTPMAVSHEGQGRVVFEYEPLVGSYFMRSGLKSNLSRCTKVGVSLESAEDKTLLFESRFESGNLAKAVQVSPNEYELWLRCDLYTDKHTQWYYFQLRNTRVNVPYRLTIVNFMKNDSLYNCGMRPLMYSEREAEEKNVGWMRTGSDIVYYKNNITYMSGKQERSYYSLTWTCVFPHSNDTVYFAHCYPYTYSDLQEYLSDILNDPFKSRFCRQRLLCRSLADNSVYSVTITSPSDNAAEMKRRKAVVLTSRVHPGESNASWMMKGFLDFLLSDSTDAKLLRDNFLFRIIPMLNPDGVIVGNYRCSLTGRDLNRNYKTLLKELFPCIWHTKAMIKRLLDDREIAVYCDLHGHSRKQNTFIYGCENRNNETKYRKFHEQVFPYMLSRNAPNVFSFNSCKFHVQKNKEGTGRVVMWAMGIANSYTLEATFCGSSLGKTKGFHYGIADYEALGYHFCDTLLDYCDPDNTKVQNVLLELEERMKMEIFSRLRHLNANDPDAPKDVDDIDLNKHYMSDIESSDGGSDSSASDGPPDSLQYVGSKSGSRKKKLLKTKKERDKKKGLMSAPPFKDRKTMATTTASRLCMIKDQIDKKTETPALNSSKPMLPRSAHANYSHTHVAPQVAGFIQERLEDGNAKRVNGRYLEALTEACIKEGLRCKTNQINKGETTPNLRSADVTKQRMNSSKVTLQNNGFISCQPVPGKLQHFALPDDISTEMLVTNKRNQTTIERQLVKTGISFRTQSLKILDRQLLQRFPSRVERYGMSSDATDGIIESPRDENQRKQQQQQQQQHNESKDVVDLSFIAESRNLVLNENLEISALVGKRVEREKTIEEFDPRHLLGGASGEKSQSCLWKKKTDEFIEIGNKLRGFEHLKVPDSSSRSRLTAESSSKRITSSRMARMRLPSAHLSPSPDIQLDRLVVKSRNEAVTEEDFSDCFKMTQSKDARNEGGSFDDRLKKSKHNQTNVLLTSRKFSLADDRSMSSAAAAAAVCQGREEWGVISRPFKRSLAIADSSKRGKEEVGRLDVLNFAEGDGSNLVRSKSSIYPLTTEPQHEIQSSWQLEEAAARFAQEHYGESMVGENYSESVKRLSRIDIASPSELETFRLPVAGLRMINATLTSNDLGDTNNENTTKTHIFNQKSSIGPCNKISLTMNENQSTGPESGFRAFPLGRTINQRPIIRNIPKKRQS